jgi:hypothetical protein
MRIIPHLTRPGGDFTSTIILTNTGNQAIDFTLTPYTEDGGTDIQVVESRVQPEQALMMTPEELFGTDEVSHFSIDEGSGLVVTVSYQDVDQNFSQAHVRESAETAFRWRIYPGDLADVADGIAVVNGNEESILVKARQRNSDGSIIDQVNLFGGSLAAHAKGLYVFSTDFNKEPGSFFEIYSDSEFALLALRFATGNSRYFWQTAATPMDALPVTVPTGAQVGQVAQLSSLAHGVSGTVTIVDSQTLRLDNFNFDGGGIEVRIYLARLSNFSDGFSVGPDLVRTTPYVNETMEVALPQNLDFSTFDRVSVWCIPAGANFGSGTFDDP